VRGWLIPLITASCLGCTRDRAAPPPDSLTVSIEQHSTWVRNFNPLSPTCRRMTRAGIHEPLMIRNAVTGEMVPWLATAYRWSDDNLALTFTIREGVKFSDGHPLDTEDVVYSFDILKQYPALDTGGLWGVLDRVVADGPNQVTAHFKTPFVPRLVEIAQQPILPAHVWKQVDNPVTFTNPNPVATGPFAKIGRFGNQIYTLERNPHYWQPGVPKVRELRFPAFPGNEQANLALVTGKLDWAGNFVPAVERTFVARDPAHHQYWFPSIGSMVLLYPNTKVAPFDDKRVREAFSRAVDRDRIVEVAMFGYTRPADETGLTDGHAPLGDSSLTQQFDWTRYDPAKAAKLLDDAGHTKGPDGMRFDGKEFVIEVVSGWSDWVRAAQVVATQLKAIGVNAKVRAFEFSAWFERMHKGSFQLAIGWADDGASQHDYFVWLMGSEKVKPIGESSIGNFHRFGHPDADKHLKSLRKSSAPEVVKSSSHALQRVFAEQVPAIPLFPNPQWGLVNTKRIVGFPSKDDPYAPLGPHIEPSVLLVLTRIEPREVP
jgi:peptide/nickel transport system substrate-binding protein